MLQATCFNDGNKMIGKYEKNYVLIHLNISCHISQKPNGYMKIFINVKFVENSMMSSITSHYLSKLVRKKAVLDNFQQGNAYSLSMDNTTMKPISNLTNLTWSLTKTR